MHTLTDPQLLRAYAEDRSEAAFAELVRRHVDLTYSVALRIVRDPHLAEDVTQAVFVALAQNATALSLHPVLSGWLHRAARNVASQMVRTEVRRRAREQEAVSMNEPPSGDEPPWEEIEPHLDAALAALEDADRDAVLLRYFEGKTAREIAGVLGIGAEAAQKRVSRAVEQLRILFARRGVVVTVGGLTALMTSHAVQAAPAGLAAAVSGAATLAAAATAVVPGTAVEVGTATTVGGVPMLASGTAIPATASATAATVGGLVAAWIPKVLAGCAVVAAAGFGIHSSLENRALRQQVRQQEARIAAGRVGSSNPALAVSTGRAAPLAGARQPVFPTDGALPLAGVGTDAPAASDAQAILRRMDDEQRRLLESIQGVRGGGGMGAGRIAGGGGFRGGAASGGSMGTGVASGGGGASQSGVGASASTGGTKLECVTVNGGTVVRYGNLEVPVGPTRGLVTTRSILLGGREYAAAFDDDRVIWESSPGAAQKLR